jgi:elongation factor Ts
MQYISVTQLRELRNRTGAGMMDCRAALETSQGNLDQATELLRQQALQEAERRANRETGQGLVGVYLHHNGRLGAMVELQCETDFVARTEVLGTLVNQLAEQVAAENPDSGEVLLAQAWIRDPSVTIDELIKQASAKVGERLRLGRLARLQVGQ